MKIRVVSDLHCDINGTFEFGFNNLNDVDVTLIAGDIAGDYEVEEKYLYEKISTKHPVICVGGNHLGYDYLFKKSMRKQILDGTKEYSINHLITNNNSNIHYLNNVFLVLENKLIFGGTMYTDFNLYKNSGIYKNIAERYMNDFRYVYTMKDFPNIRAISADDYIEWFKQFKTRLFTAVKIAKKNNYEVIVLTHFAPSKKSISNKYNGAYKELNPAYAADMSRYIRDHDCIKLWVHGHMHDSFDYNIKQCRVVCAPYGYSRESSIKPEEYIGKVIEI